MTDKEKSDTMTIGEIKNLIADCNKEINKTVSIFHEATGIWVGEIILMAYHKDGEPVFKAELGQLIY